MTTADTNNTEAVVMEAITLFEAGAELVRMTAQGPREARNLEMIRRQLNERGYTGPLVADIHFSPKAAMIAVEYVEKVRINPGNFVDTKRFEHIELTDAEYASELDRLDEAFRPLVLRARELGRSLRIGVNHGSLSDRIMNRFGDTPEGMVESAIEFLRIGASYDYHDMVVSMKASNPYVMMQAYRLLVDRFRREGMNYPLHLGVTEAGEGRDGRIKSSIGIGALLLDGIGDTIRVSLTEDAVHEMPAAREIIRASQVVQTESYLSSLGRILSEEAVPAPPSPSRSRPVAVAVPMPLDLATDAARHHFLSSFQFLQGAPDFLFVDRDQLPEARRQFPRCFRQYEDVRSEDKAPDSPLAILRATSIADLPDDCGVMLSWACIRSSTDPERPDTAILESLAGRKHPTMILFEDRTDLEIVVSATAMIGRVLPDFVLALDTGSNPVYPWRALLAALIHHQAEQKKADHALPLLMLYYRSSSDSDSLFRIPAEAGSLLLEGIGDILAIDTKAPAATSPALSRPDRSDSSHASLEALATALDILQATRLRITRTEFISCPSCGRTLFNLQETTARIKLATGHLKGVKIAIMGCIVNGPGEMADADFGYVGAGPGRINLYRGKEVVRRNIPSETADRELISLIREAGMWTDPVAD